MSTYDVAVIGGGVIGSSIAFELAAEKLRVVVLDRGKPGSEASWAAAGMLSPGPDSPRDIPLVPLGRESLRLYPRFVAAIEETSGKKINYERKGTLEIFLAPHGQRERNEDVAEYRQLGLAADPVSLEDVRQMEPSIGTDARAALRLPDEGTVDPRLLMDALLAAAGRRGAEIRSYCAATGLLYEAGRCVGVVADGERISARHVVLAAGCFSAEVLRDADNLTSLVPTRPVRGQMLALRPDGFALHHVLRFEKCYLVPRQDGRVIAGSTSEEGGFEKRVTPAGMRKVLSGALEMCPGLAGAEILETWSGLRPGTPDDLPILGPSGMEGLLIATGHYRNGILLAPVTAKLVREWIVTGRTSFDAAPFSPSRFASKHHTAARHGD